MANRYWALAGAGTWNTVNSWSDTDGGSAPATSFPISVDSAYIKKDLTASTTITLSTTPQQLPAYLYAEDTVSPGSFAWLIGTTLQQFNLLADATIEVPASSQLNINPKISGAFTVTKAGQGALVIGAGSTTSTVMIQDGKLGAPTNSFAASADILIGNPSMAPTGAIELFSTSSVAQTCVADITVNRDFNLQVSSTGAYTLSGSVAFGSTTKTVTVGNATTITGAIIGTAGFTKAGAATLIISPTAGNPGNTGLTGPIDVATGQISLFSTTTAVALASAHAFSISAGANVFYYSGGTGTNAITALTTYSGDGVVTTFRNSATAGVTWSFPANALAGLSGVAAPSGSVPQSGLSLYVDGSANGSMNETTVQDLPSVVAYRNVTTTAAANTTRFRFAGTGATYPTRIDLITSSTTSPAASTHEFYANNAAGLLKLTGGITRAGTAGTTSAMTFTLRGTGAGGAELSGDITGTLLSITKNDANRWILSGANTYTGGTTINAGTLSAQGTAGTKTPLGGSGAVTVTAVTGSGTLDISSTGTDANNLMSVNKAATTLSLGGTATAQLTSTTGFNEYVCAGVTLNTTLPVSVAAGAYLRMGNTSAMTQSGGTYGVTKTGAGEYNLGSTGNTFAGTVTVTEGTLAFESSVLSSTNSPLGNSTTAIPLTGTLKYRGSSAASVTRSVTLTGAAPALDASGTGAVTFSAYTHAAGARTVTFKGSSTNDNTLSAALTDSVAGAVVALTKAEAGKWILSAQPTYTGLTTISGGELQFNENNLATDVTLNGTGKLAKTVLTGVSKTITCDGGTPEIEATTSANTITGATNVTAGSLRVTTEAVSGGQPVKVLGETNVTVTGTLQTTKGTVQRGRMTYGGNLTFNAGSTLRIG